MKKPEMEQQRKELTLEEEKYLENTKTEFLSSD